MHFLSFLEFVVDPIQGGKEKPKYYHRQFRRVPTIDECEIDDQVCIFESNAQFKRDKYVYCPLFVLLYYNVQFNCPCIRALYRIAIYHCIDILAIRYISYHS